MTTAGFTVALAYDELLEGIKSFRDEFTATTTTLSSLITTISESADHASGASHAIGEKTTNVAGMLENITASSQKIAESISVIEGITYQTNILALDTAIEAPEQPRAALDDLIDSVQHVDSILADIAVASAEQSSGIDQVNEAIERVGAVTPQNAVLVEQAAAATASLEGQAQMFLQTVSAFSLNVYLAHA